MKFKHSYYLIALVSLFYSCSEDNVNSEQTKKPLVQKVEAITVSPDSANVIKIIPAGTPSSCSIGKLSSIPSHINIRKLDLPKQIELLDPIRYQFGKGYSKPKPIPNTGSKIIAGLPEIIAAKEPSMKDHNPESFGSFNKLQGLKHGRITSLLQDKKGNLWLSINGGGICKYDGQPFTSYTDKQGLVNNFAWSIFEDSKNNIWFGLSSGFAKFDGKYFTFFNTDNDTLLSTTSSMCEDKNGDIWVSTYKGAVRYDGKNFYHYKAENGLCDGQVKKIIQDKKGQLWFATPKNGLFKLDGDQFLQYTEQQNLPCNTINDIFEDDKGNIWLAMAGKGFGKLNGNSLHNYDNENRILNSDIVKFSKDSDSNLWLATNGNGAFKFDGTFITNYSETEGLNNNEVNLVLEDRNKNLWFATNGGGFSIFSGRLFSHVTTFEGLTHNYVNSIAEDKQGNLWFATDGGISKYDGHQIFQITKDNGLPSDHINNILEGDDGKIWFSSSKGLGYIENDQIKTFGKKEGISSKPIYYLMKDHKGYIWVSNGSSLLFFDGTNFNYLPKINGLTNDEVNTMIEDKNGNYWFGTFIHGLWKLSGKTFTNYNKSSGLVSNDIRTMMQDNEGNIWLGTYGNGVVKFNGTNFTNYTEKEGLCNNFIYSVVQDRKGEVWFATRLGLSKINDQKSFKRINKKSEVLFKNFTYEDGFLGIGCNRNSICVSKTGNIWIGTSDRLTLYHPNGETLDTLAPKTELTRIELFNENIPWKNIEQKKDTTLILDNGIEIGNMQFDSVTKWYDLPLGLNLAYNTNNISFKFIGITQKQSKKVKYKYKLEGVDPDWSTLTSNTYASYGNINNGTYTFKVKAMNSEGYWSNELSYNLIIRPPWWKTWWFRILITISMISLIGIIFRWRNRQLIARQQQLEKTVAERTEEISKQKNLIEEKHKEITDSINYAERIQKSFLATKEHLDANLKEYFILYKPKDIVSGDFYWSANLTNGNFILATADSTGHGVPGAIMSLLNITSLEKAIETETEPSSILNTTRNIIIERLKKDGSTEGGKDGMDCSICIYDLNKKKLLVSAAHNPVWIARGSEVIEITADKMPVGKHDKQSTPFTQHEIQLQDGDMIYTLTDGYADQFGGPSGKKFMSKNLRKLISINSHLSLKEQLIVLETTFINWAKNHEQIDDVTIIGVKI